MLGLRPSGPFASLVVLAAGVGLTLVGACSDSATASCDADACDDAGVVADASASTTDAASIVDASAPVVDASTCPPGILCTAKPLYTSKIGMWYTLWWMPGNTGHWLDWARYQPLAGYYQSGQGAAFATHLADFAAMKLDFLLLDHTNGVDNDGGDIKKNGEALLATLKASTTTGVKQAIAGGAPLWMGSSPDKTAQQTEDDYVYSTFANPKIASRMLDTSGLPLFVVYTAPGAGDDWTDPRFGIGSATGTSSGASAVMRSHGLFGWVFDEPTIVDKRVMGTMPGWSTAHLGRATTPILREGGNLFVREWLKAIKENPDTIMINSWNDFAEETAIEPATRTIAGAELWADSYGTECSSFYHYSGM